MDSLSKFWYFQFLVFFSILRWVGGFATKNEVEKGVPQLKRVPGGW